MKSKTSPAGKKTATATAARKPAAPEAEQRRPAVPAQRGNTALSTMNYGDVGTRAGQEDADRDAFAIPFILILQKLSPQLDKNDKAVFIEGAEEGDFLNTATGEVYDGQEGILVMHVDFKRSFVAWGLREKGGGYKGEHSTSDPIVLTTTVDEKRRNVLPDKQTQLVDTRLHGVILLTGDVPSPALVSFTSTQVKKSKKWMTAMSERQAKDNKPFFAHVYKLTTIPEKNDQGNWMGWQVEPVGEAQEQEHVDAAVAFYKSLRAGAVRLRPDQQERVVNES